MKAPKFTTQISATIGKTKQRFSRLQPGRHILAIEIAGSRIMAAVAEKRGNQLQIQNFVAIDRTTANDDLPDTENIRELMDRLHYPSGPAVLITPMARSVQIAMNRVKVGKLRPYQLCDALRWEVEPYTGISGNNALIGAEKGSPTDREDLLLLDEDEIEIDVNASVIERNVYRAMKQILQRSGLKLIRIYPPEVCFFVPLFLHDVESAQAVFDIGADYANFTIVKGGKPKQINTYPLGKEILLDLIENGQQVESEQSLDFLLRQIPGPLPLILTGIGAGHQKIVSFLDARSPYGALPLNLHRADKLARSGHADQNTMYCATVGAALRELMGKKWRPIGITDEVPVSVRIKESAYLVPVAFAVLLVAGLFGHYQYMKITNMRYKEQTQKLKVQIKEKKAKFETYTALEKKRNTLKDTRRRYKRQIDFLHHGADDNLTHIGNVLKSFYTLPPAMQLESLQQQENEQNFELTGLSDDSNAIGAYAVALQKLSWCTTVDIRELQRRSQEKGLHFLIIMETTPETPESKQLEMTASTQKSTGKTIGKQP